MTRHLTDEDTKLHVSMEDANRLVSENLKLLNASTLSLPSSHISIQAKCLQNMPEKQSTIKTRGKNGTLRSRLAKTMHRLYDLEPEHVTEKRLNIDFDVDLYQMEDY